MTKSGLAAAACILLAACGAPPKPKPAAPVASVPLMIASPESEAAPAALEARLTVSEDSQTLLRFEVEADGTVQGVSVLDRKSVV